MLRGIWRPIVTRSLRSQGGILGRKHPLVRYYSQNGQNNEKDPLNLDALFGHLKDENGSKVVHNSETNQGIDHGLEKALLSSEKSDDFDHFPPEELLEDGEDDFVYSEADGAEFQNELENLAMENGDYAYTGPEEEDFALDGISERPISKENEGDHSPYEFFEDPSSEAFLGDPSSQDLFEDPFSEDFLDKNPNELLKDNLLKNTSPTGTKSDSLYDDIMKDIESYIDEKGLAGIDLDHNDEADYQLDVPADQRPSPDVVQEEKNLFKNIFSTFLHPTEDESVKLRAEDNILWNLRDSLKKSQDKFNSLEIKRKLTEFNKISDLLKGLVFQRTEAALAETFKHIDNELTTIEQQLEFLKDTYGRWCQSIEAAKTDTYVHEQSYLGHVLRLKGPRFTQELSDLVRTIREKSEESPKHPELNVFSMPVIFNHILRNLGFRFYAGQVALSVFNLLKKDLNVYSTIINQQTYNEVLKLYWLYQGKSNLYGVEMIYIEMLNNGFNGDVVTFNVLKQIIVDYHTLKLGKGESGVPLWTREDDKRVQSLEAKLARLAGQLKRSQ